MSSFVLLCQLALATKTTNGSTSGEALVSPAPPSYEEATAGMTTPYPPIFHHKVSVSLFLTNNVYHVLG